MATTRARRVPDTLEVRIDCCRHKGGIKQSMVTRLDSTTVEAKLISETSVIVLALVW
jgi:hypothetical protein